jgi:hypothetical protein
MHDRGTFDDEKLVKLIEERKIALVALNYELLERQYRGRTIFWSRLQKAIAANYTAVASLGPPYLMAPRDRSSATPVIETPGAK